MDYTLTYSEGVAGWVSFYSFYPDWMIGMNQYFYTFKNGNLYRHNVNNNRNTFYGIYTPSTLKSVFNTAPLENKLFKTINIEGDAPWSVALETDIQISGGILDAWFEKKEQSYFAFIRNGTDGELAIRSTNGIGASYQINLAGDTIDFSINPLVDLGTIMSIGDYLYFMVPPYPSTINFAGEITQINRNYPAGVNQIVINTSLPGTVPITVPNAYYFYTKNSVAESHGVLGHYCVFELTNGLKTKVELFAVESEVMKSFP